MKKITVLFISLIIMASLTACANADNPAPDIADEDKLTIKMEFDKDYDDADPFVNEKLFTVSEDMETLIAEGTLNLDGESVILEVKKQQDKGNLMEQHMGQRGAVRHLFHFTEKGKKRCGICRMSHREKK